MNRTFILELQKNNHGEPGIQLEINWSPDAQMFVGKKRGRESFDARLERDANDRDDIRRALNACHDAGIDVSAATTGPNTGFKVLSQRPELPEWWRSSKIAKKRFDTLIVQMRASGEIKDVPYKLANRRPSVRITLTEKGLLQCSNVQKP